MKKYLLIASLFVASFTQAQSVFSVTELSGGAPAQSHYTFTTDTSDASFPTFLMEFKIQNVSGNSHICKIRKQVMSICTNTVTALEHDMYFCFNQTCYTPGTFYSFANMAAGASLPNGGTSYGLRTEMDHNDIVGTSVVRYTVYDSTNTGDSMNITISYNILSSIGIKHVSNPTFVSNAMPNPASNLVNFNYELNGASNASVKIYNSLGNLVRTITLGTHAKNAQVDISSLDEGCYFYSVIADGKAISTRRLVIAR